MKVKVHNTAGFPYTEDGIWFIPCLCETNDGFMATHPVAFLDQEDVFEVQKYFKSPTLEPLELLI